MLPSPQLRDVSVIDYLLVIKRRIWIVLACFVIITTWSVVRTYKKTFMYRSYAKIYIDRTNTQITPSQMQQVYTPAPWADREYLESQINIMTSRTIAKKVVDNLIAQGDTTFVHSPDPEAHFLGGVNIFVLPGTQILNVGYVSSDPIQTAKFANMLVQTYIKEDVNKRVGVTQNASGWLDSKLNELGAKMSAAEAKLNEYVQKNKIVIDVGTKNQSNETSLKQIIMQTERELGELSKRYRSKHPKIVLLSSRLESAKKSLEEEAKRTLDYNSKMFEYTALQREVDTNRRLYEDFLRKTRETEAASDMQITNIRIVDLADVPKAPFSPNRQKDVTSGVMLALFVGVIIAFLLEYLDSTIKHADDIEIYVKLPFLGYVPSARREVKLDAEIDVASARLPQSRIAEAYRSVRTSIIFSAPEDRPLKTILITSSLPQEGKTTVSMNLGIVFAKANEKTLIVEADMRKPRICKSLGLSFSEGLSTYLTGATNLEQSVKETGIPNLFLLPCGPKPPNPAELLISMKTKQLIEELKGSFDRIIIDSPPIMTVTDTAILANVVDGVIDVVRAAFANIELILRGRQRLLEAKARMIGAILNNVNVKKEDSYYYYHYYYSEDKDKK